MLYEITDVKNHENEPRRKWFFDHLIDLTVWFDDAGQIVGWQLVYDKPNAPHALTWFKESGYAHNKVDDGEVFDPTAYKGIPILLPNGKMDFKRLISLFQEKSKEIDQEIAGFVLNGLDDAASVI